jgi:hypothetical protein
MGDELQNVKLAEQRSTVDNVTESDGWLQSQIGGGASRIKSSVLVQLLPLCAAFDSDSKSLGELDKRSSMLRDSRVEAAYDLVLSFRAAVHSWTESSSQRELFSLLARRCTHVRPVPYLGSS